MLAPTHLQQLGTNAYGPTHNLIAFVYAIHPNAPRILFCWLWLAGGVLLLHRCAADRLPSWISWLIVFALYVNPYFFRLYVYGQNDLAVSGLLLISVLCHRARRDLAAGLLFALSLSYKFYPIVMLPFLLVDQQRMGRLADLFAQIRWRFAVALDLSLALVMGVALLVLGPSFLSPYRFLAERAITESSLAYSFLHLFNAPWLADLGFLPGALLLAIVILMACWRRWPPDLAAIMALLSVFILSPVFYYVYCIGAIALLFEQATHASRMQLYWRTWIPPMVYMALMAGVFALLAILSRFPAVPLMALKGLIYGVANLVLLLLLMGLAQSPRPGSARLLQG
ncbi:MAG: glycosyltransferase 87 family protein [Cyanobium sp.]